MTTWCCQTFKRIAELVTTQQAEASAKTAAGKAIERDDPSWTDITAEVATDKPSYEAVKKLIQQIESDMEKVQIVTVPIGKS